MGIDLHAHIKRLAGELEEAKLRIRELEDALGAGFQAPLALGLTKHEGQLLGLLVKRQAVMREMAMAVMYGDAARQPQDDRILDVYIARIRKKLDQFGIEIKTMWGSGWVIEPEHKAKIHALTADEVPV
ncbi:MAG TPA: helix-turn-helix domain-containing protein [Dongiaceae bacterium]|nr:helix-turn-helix domain-containing protein [Dongiaceae bacterium]